VNLNSSKKDKKMKKIALIGRPNVGKSTLFNLLTHSRDALVHDTPGVTRDYKEKKATVFGRDYIIVDTAGLENKKDSDVSRWMRESTELAIGQADVILFMVDARTGLHQLDEYFANIVRRTNKPIFIVGNKSETKISKENLMDFYSLGIGDQIYAISAEHNQGLGELFDAVESVLPQEEVIDLPENYENLSNEENSEETKTLPSKLKLCIIGRPNAGKSTLLNSLIGEKRVITGDFAGLTRDSISTDFVYHGRDIELVDTAGIRKKSKISERLEQISVSKAIEAINFAHITLLLVDSEQLLDNIMTGLDKQDLQLAEYAVKEGKSVIIGLNKWDLLDVDQRKEVMKEVQNRLSYSFSQVKGVQIYPISALKEKGLKPLMDNVIQTFDDWDIHISTSKLNKWLDEALANNPPPLSRLKRPMSVKYITQGSTRPPTFILFVGGASDLPESYKRYLLNHMSNHFGLKNIPLRLKIKNQKNPYGDKR